MQATSSRIAFTLRQKAHQGDGQISTSINDRKNNEQQQLLQQMHFPL